MNRLSKALLIAAFALLILLPMPLWLLLGGGAGDGRTMEEKQPLIFQSVTDFPQRFEQWFAEHMPFRTPLLRWQMRLNAAMHSIENDRVLIGRDGWLFYGEKQDGDPIACYLGTNLYTEAKLQSAASALTALRERLAEQGTELVLMIVPNKERVYAEWMPERFGKPSAAYQASQLVEYLRAQTDVRVVFPLDALMAAKDLFADEPLYRKADTHWNEIGAYVGTAELLRELGIPPVPFTEIRAERAGECERDLANMILMGDVYGLDDAAYRLSGVPSGICNTTEGISRGNGGSDSRSMVLFRDSFGKMMLPYLAGAFNQITAECYPADILNLPETKEADLLVIECVERYADRMVTWVEEQTSSE